jgi:hypothetical protein
MLIEGRKGNIFEHKIADISVWRKKTQFPFLGRFWFCSRRAQTRAFHQGCQIFLDTIYQHGKNIPNGHKYTK